jgi:hypothetical protein
MLQLGRGTRLGHGRGRGLESRNPFTVAWRRYLTEGGGSTDGTHVLTETDAREFLSLIQKQVAYRSRRDVVWDLVRHSANTSPGGFGANERQKTGARIDTITVLIP